MNILKNRYIYLIISAVLFVVSVFLIFIPKLNLWIDMTGWTQIEYTFVKSFDLETLRDKLQKTWDKVMFEWNKVINSVTAYTVSWEKTIVIISWFDNTIDEKKLDILKSDFRKNVLALLQEYDPKITERSYTNIWKSFWDYIKNTAFTTLVLAILVIAIYIAYAFSWITSWISIMSFSLITIITLFHDVIISTWAYILTSMFFPEFVIDTFFITALLTILWYSITDTIIIFDRIRYNLILFWGKKWSAWMNLQEIINLSLNQTIKRSLYTSLTVVFVLFSIFFFWPVAIKWFILALIYGTFFGTISSIFIASPILYEFNKNKSLVIHKKVIVKPEDKYVV